MTTAPRSRSIRWGPRCTPPNRHGQPAFGHDPNANGATAALVAFPLSGEALFINGAVITIDSGQSDKY